MTVGFLQSVYNTNNMFWLDYIIAIEDLIVERQPFTVLEVCATPIWQNSKLCHTKISACFKRGSRFIGDLLNPFGHKESREENICDS